MPSANYLTMGAYAAGLIATLVLAAWLTPARWWRRPNLRAASILVAGTWGLGALLLSLLPAALPALAAAPSNAGISYTVYDDLNLRADKGIGAQRIAVAPAGTVVTTTGLRDGDWWQVSARIDGKIVRGWSSSLWLRRAEEARR
ncbi:SH3 domain-containing protein [Massilia pseudoviolaceinigra]|uniref:SH3 domain-containing protein n=1 Tax=Massilia pseudoviolaceinigra TaxID=3057165 RepID=UPI002796A48A|nr:SH3 domain-containing protein [Massilia sp. CCM 9206]MDQ1922440.1 SH3 domain-containing protein [Massilia sp. CCM 9206]